MSQGINSWIVAALRPPAVVLKFVLGSLYSILFRRADKRSAARDEQRLARDIQDALPSLFSEYQGRIVRSGDSRVPPPFDYATVTIALADVLIRFTRGRRELAVYVAPVFAPTDWHELSLVLGAIGGEEDIERGGFRDLWDVSRVLPSQIKGVFHIFSPGEFDTLKHRLDDEIYSRDKVAIREWQAEINRRLYGR